MEQSTRSVRLASWKEIVKRCSNRPEGMTQKQWLADNSIHEKNYYYWQRQVRNEAYAEMTHCPIPAGKPQTGITFAEIPVHQPIPEQQMHDFKADAVIRTSNATIALSNNVSALLLDKIMETVSHAR